MTGSTIFFKLDTNVCESTITRLQCPPAGFGICVTFEGDVWFLFVHIYFLNSLLLTLASCASFLFSATSPCSVLFQTTAIMQSDVSPAHHTHTDMPIFCVRRALIQTTWKQHSPASFDLVRRLLAASTNGSSFILSYFCRRERPIQPPHTRPGASLSLSEREMCDLKGCVCVCVTVFFLQGNALMLK